MDLAVTLDGYIEGPRGEIDWCIMDEEIQFEDFLSTIDTIFYGRVSYEQWGRYRPDEHASDLEKSYWKAINSKKKYVFTRSQRDFPGAEAIRGGIKDREREIQAQPGKAIWLFGGASLITTLLQEDLIDEYRLSIHPVVLGSGKPLFAGLDFSKGLILKSNRIFKTGVVQLIIPIIQIQTAKKEAGDRHRRHVLTSETTKRKVCWPVQANNVMV